MHYDEKLSYEDPVKGGTEVDMDFLSKMSHMSLIKHCCDAMYMSYYKYDHINQYVGDNAMMFYEASMRAYKDTHNAEHIVDAVNYLMIRQMFHPNEYDLCLQEAMQLDRVYDESKYKGTDSSGSTKPITVRELIYGHYYDSKPPRISDGHITIW